jgi:hypothetical protein
LYDYAPDFWRFLDLSHQLTLSFSLDTPYFVRKHLRSDRAHTKLSQKGYPARNVTAPTILRKVSEFLHAARSVLARGHRAPIIQLPNGIGAPHSSLPGLLCDNHPRPALLLLFCSLFRYLFPHLFLDHEMHFGEIGKAR